MFTNVHVLIAKIKLGNNDSCKSMNHFDFSALRHRFQNILLRLFDKNLASAKFKKLKSFLFANYKDGFYVYAESKKFNNLKSGIEYVTRYCVRVPISENRILNYDGENVTYSYIAHEDNSGSY